MAGLCFVTGEYLCGETLRLLQGKVGGYKLLHSTAPLVAAAQPDAVEANWDEDGNRSKTNCSEGPFDLLC